MKYGTIRFHIIVSWIDLFFNIWLVVLNISEAHATCYSNEKEIDFQLESPSVGCRNIYGDPEMKYEAGKTVVYVKNDYKFIWIAQ